MQMVSNQKLAVNYLSIIQSEPMYVDRTSLKRNKRSFESTALNSMRESRTVPRSYAKIPMLNMDADQTTKPVQPDQEKQAKMESKVELKEKIEQIAINIIEEERKCKAESGSKFMRHFYFRGITRAIQHPLLQIPQLVFDLFFREQMKRKRPSSPPVAVCQGYLRQINCIYYAIENTIIFIRVQDLLDCNQSTIELVSHLVHEVRSQVINIVELPRNSLLFQDWETVLAIVHPWEMEFFAWSNDTLMKDNTSGPEKAVLKPLHYIYKFPVEIVKEIGVGSDGRLFYFDQQGALYQITPEQQTKLLVCKTGRYTIRNYINSSHNTFELLSNKGGKLGPILNLASNIKQLSMYLFPSTITTEGIFCDSKKELLFALLVKNTKLVFGQDRQVFVVCYSIRQGEKAKLLHKMSQQWLVEKYLKHSPVSEPNQNYEIHSIAPGPPCLPTANVTIITKSGIQIIMQILPNEGRIVEVVRPPDHRVLELPPASADGFTNQYAPKDKNEYKLYSACGDWQPYVCTLARKDSVFTYVAERTLFTGGIDINMKVAGMDLDIYKSGSWKVAIHQINTPYSQPGQAVSQLSSQLMSAPMSYILMNESKLQLMSYLRPIDILFTTLQLISSYEQSPQHRRRHPHRSASPSPKQLLAQKQKLVTKLFITKPLEFSLVSNLSITKHELCSMLLQIQMDEGGLYVYSGIAAPEVMGIWVQLTQGKYGGMARMGDFGFQDQNAQYTNREEKARQHESKIGHNQLYPYSKIPKATLLQCNSQLQYLCSEGVSSREQNRVLQKIGALTLHLSQLLQPMWNKPLNSFSPQSLTRIQGRVEQVQKYIQRESSSMRVYSTESEAVNGEVRALLQLVDRVRQLILLLLNVPVLGLTSRFCDCLLEAKDLQECMFWAIHREYKYYIIKAWNTLFPFYASPQFLKLILLYGQLEQISDREQLIRQLKTQSNIQTLPEYFLEYLGKIRKLSHQNIIQIFKENRNMVMEREKQPGDPDFQLVLPLEIKQIVQHYKTRSQQMNEADLQAILSLLMNTDNKARLTISNKRSLLAYLRLHLTLPPKLLFMAKCISVQYELYRYYLGSLSPAHSPLWHTMLGGKKETIKVNDETMELLKFNTIVDAEQLRKLVWVTADYWLMADYCLLFQDLDGLKTIFRSVCNQFEGINSKKYSSFPAYTERYLLNFAIKSDYDDSILALACQVIDEYLESLAITKKTVKQWLSFDSLPAITDKLIWLPKLLVKAGFEPQKIVSIYLQQLSTVFNSQVPLPNQTMYCLKLLTAFTLCSQYPGLQDKTEDLTRMATTHLNTLQRHGNVEEKMQIGLRKMMDNLIGNIQ